MPDELLQLLSDESIDPRERLRIAAQLRRDENRFADRPVTRKSLINDMQIILADAALIGDEPMVLAVRGLIDYVKRPPSVGSMVKYAAEIQHVHAASDPRRN